MDTLLRDVTALGLLAIVILLTYNFAGRLFAILNAHLAAVQDMDKRQTILLEACHDSLSAIQESLQKQDSI